MDAGGRRRRRHTAGIGAAWRRTASSCRGAADNGKKGGKQRGALRDLACTHRPGALGGLEDAARRVNVTHPWAGRLAACPIREFASLGTHAMIGDINMPGVFFSPLIGTASRRDRVCQYG